jgi:hypothetical protein
MPQVARPSATVIKWLWRVELLEKLLVKLEHKFAASEARKLAVVV